MNTSMTSRQRMLAAINCQQPDHTPCSFMLYKGLLSGSRDYLDFVQRQLDLGLDAYVQVPPRAPRVVSDSYNLHGLPVAYNSAVTVKEWKETPADQRWPVLVKEYYTPAGRLRAEVNQDDEWPYGDHLPFLDDYVETRSRKYIVSGLEDLPALGYLLESPGAAEIAAYRAEAAPAIEFARSNDLLLVGGWGVGADLVGWVYGLQAMMYASYDRPEFLEALLGMIADWNRKRMQVVLESGVNLYVKRAWYENTMFWSPKTWKRFIYPHLKADAGLAHAYGSSFGYLITADCMPLLEMIADAGVDVIQGVDPARYDLAATKRRIGERVCLWGGVNGHLTVEQGSPEQVRAEVQTAMDVLAPGGGFILSPVDNVRVDDENTRGNVGALIDAWQSCWRSQT